MRLNSDFKKKVFKKAFVLTILVVLATFSLGCKKEVAKKEVPSTVVEEELPYEKIDDISEEDFDDLTVKVRDQIMVFDIAEVHDELYPVLKASIDLDTTDDKIEAQIKQILEPFMEEWTTNKIRTFLISELGEVSDNDIEKFQNKIDNESLIDFIIIYEKNFLKGSK